MALQPYEALFRWKEDGTFSGGHTIARDDVTAQLSEPVALGTVAFPFVDIGADINASSLSTIAARDTEITGLNAAAAAKDAAIATLRAQVIALGGTPEA